MKANEMASSLDQNFVQFKFAESPDFRPLSADPVVKRDIYTMANHYEDGKKCTRQVVSLQC